MTLFETDLLTELCARKHEVLSDLCALGRRQLELIDADDLSELLKVLSAKQQLLAQLQLAERQLDPFRDQPPEARQWRTPGQRQHCAQLIQRCEALLSEIVSQERHGEQQLRVRRDEAAARLEGARAADAARGAYQDHLPRGASQVDLFSET